MTDQFPATRQETFFAAAITGLLANAERAPDPLNAKEAQAAERLVERAMRYAELMERRSQRAD